METSTGYSLEASGKTQCLMGTKKYELWETKILGYQGLKEIVLNRPGADTAEENENAYTEFIQSLNDCSLGLVMAQARDNGYEGPIILCEHYDGRCKPRIIALYHQLT